MLDKILHLKPFSKTFNSEYSVFTNGENSDDITFVIFTVYFIEISVIHQKENEL